VIEVIKVLFYSGGKRDEVPKTVFTNSRKIRVHKVLETYLEEDYKSGMRKRVFIFKSIGGDIYRLESTGEGFKINQIK